MKKLGILCFFILCIWVSAQNNDEVYFGSYTFDKKVAQKVMVSDAKVREHPNYKSNKIDSLQIGDAVNITNITTHMHSAGLREAPWYEISYKKNNQLKKGYIWGGNLALGHQKKNGVEFLFGAVGTVSRDGGAYKQVKMEVLALENNKVIDRHYFLVDNLHFTSMEILNNKGLSGIKSVIRVENAGEACGIPTNTQYLLWNGKNFFPLDLLTNVGDAGIFYHSEEYIFPSDKGGVKSKIIMKMEEAEFDEDDNEKETPINQKTDEKTFIWDGKTLSQILKLK